MLSMSAGEGVVAVLSAERWDRRSRADLIECATPCHDAQVLGLDEGSSSVRSTVSAAKSEDYTTVSMVLAHNLNF